MKCMRPIDADALEYDTEWSEYMDGFTSYSQLQIDCAPTLDVVEVGRLKDVIAEVLRKWEISDNDIDSITDVVIIKLKNTEEVCE